jgi:hypothetical protein
MVQKDILDGRPVSHFMLLDDIAGRTEEVADMFGLERAVAEGLMTQALEETGWAGDERGALAALGGAAQVGCDEPQQGSRSSLR